MGSLGKMPGSRRDKHPPRWTVNAARGKPGRTPACRLHLQSGHQGTWREVRFPWEQEEEPPPHPPTHGLHLCFEESVSPTRVPSICNFGLDQ